MTIRLFTRSLTAVLMAVGLVSAVGLSPAAAAAVKPAAVKPAAVKPNLDPVTVVAVLKQLYSYYQQFAGSGSLTLPQAVQEIENAILSAENNIIDQIDLVAAANVKACAASAVVNFADINSFTPDNLQVYALDTTDCVTLANSLLGAVTDPAAIDEIGFAMNAVGPLALMARAKAGLTTPALKAVLVAGDNALITALVPTCELIDSGDPGVFHVWDWDCFAYNGNEGYVHGKGLKYKVMAQDLATANTSRAVAQAALPTLG